MAEKIVSKFGGMIQQAPTPQEKLDLLKSQIVYVEIAPLTTEEGRISQATLRNMRETIDSLIDDFQMGKTKENV